MDTLAQLAHGFSVALTPINLAWCFAGVFIGTAIGVVGYFSVAVADALVIEAMRRLSAAEVVADTDVYIVLATSMSLVVFRQRTRWQKRAVAAGVVFTVICLGEAVFEGVTLPLPARTDDV